MLGCNSPAGGARGVLSGDPITATACHRHTHCQRPELLHLARAAEARTAQAMLWPGRATATIQRCVLVCASLRSSPANNVGDAGFWFAIVLRRDAAGRAHESTLLPAPRVLAVTSDPGASARAARARDAAGAPARSILARVHICSSGPARAAQGLCRGRCASAVQKERDAGSGSKKGSSRGAFEKLEDSH